MTTVRKKAQKFKKNVKLRIKKYWWNRVNKAIKNIPLKFESIHMDFEYENSSENLKQLIKYLENNSNNIETIGFNQLKGV